MERWSGLIEREQLNGDETEDSAAWRHGMILHECHAIFGVMTVNTLI
jgi:hypothetical protein